MYITNDKIHMEHILFGLTNMKKVKWGDLLVLQYGKRIEGYRDSNGAFLVYGTNGPIGRTSNPICAHPTIIVGRKGAYRGVFYSEEPCSVIDTAFFVIPITAVCLKWAYYALLSQDINSMDSGSAIPSTSREAFYNLDVNLPPLETQREIAHILGTLDDKIELNRKMSKTLEEMAQTLYKHWFIDFEFPNEEGKPYKSSGGEMIDSELGPIPKGWGVGKLGDLCSVEKRLIDPKKQNIDQYKLFSIQAYDDGQTARYVSSSEIQSSKLHVPDSCILISKLNPLIKRIWHVNDKSSDKVCSTEFLVITSAHSLPYLMFLLDSEQVYSVIEGSTTGTSGSHQRVNAFHVLSIKVIIPDIDSEACFHSITEDSFSMISNINSLNNKLSKARLDLYEALFDV